MPFWNKAWLLDDDDFRALVDFFQDVEKDTLVDFGPPNPKKDKGKDKPKAAAGNQITHTTIQNFLNLPTAIFVQTLEGLNNGTTLAKAKALFQACNPEKPVPDGLPHPTLQHDRMDRGLFVEYCRHLSE